MSSQIVPYSRFVHLMRKLLWLLAAMLVLVVVLVALNNSRNGERIVFTPATSTAEHESKPAMVKPHYQGVDDKGQPFTVTAALAVEEAPGVMRLEDIAGDVSFNNRRWAILNAKQGMYHKKEKVLNLSGGVDLYYDGGYEMHTPSAQVDLASGTTTGQERVNGQGPTGLIQADGFELKDRAARILFKGNVKMTLFL